eukprot:2897399-Rhodomonas_salina.5
MWERRKCPRWQITKQCVSNCLQVCTALRLESGKLGHGVILELKTTKAEDSDCHTQAEDSDCHRMEGDRDEGRAWHGRKHGAALMG